MVRENVTWGEERIADELYLKLGIYVSPRVECAVIILGDHYSGCGIPHSGYERSLARRKIARILMQDRRQTNV
jgi:hypothetical protein